MKAGLIIQARTGSTRLPGKVVRPFYDEASILDLVVERLARNRHGLGLYVATTDQPADDALAARCAEKGIACFRGDEHDVLRRFIGCADAYGLQHIVRVCADNPFLDLDLLDDMVDRGRAEAVDYAGYALDDGTPAIQTHLGFFCEFVTLEALQRVEAATNDAAAREHVTAYLYQHPDDFTLAFLDTPPLLQNLKRVRLTVDTAEDFETAQQVYRTIRESDQNVRLESIAWALKKHPELSARMARQIRLNRK